MFFNFYLSLVIFLSKVLGLLSRALGKGSGVVIAGRLIILLAPKAVARMSENKKVVLISGTNGKSTTAKLIATALSTRYQVAHNHTGANLFAGIAQALAANRKAEFAVLEVDELVLPWAIEKTNPALVVLLNLGRDQLDRLSEVRMVSNKWKAALSSANKNCTVLASSDDPFVVHAALSATKQIWFSAGERGHIDAATCPACGAFLDWKNSGAEFSCTCGFSKPAANWKLNGTELSNGKLNLEVESAIPGKAALQNAARALIVAEQFGVDVNKTLAAISNIQSVDGRFASKVIEKTKFRLLLAKNPASWRETLATSSLVSSSSSNSSNSSTSGSAVLLVVNANTQDGKDTSWLWDVDFKVLSGRNVLVTGDRRVDVSARLLVDGIAHQVVADEIAAAKVLGATDADLIASYTAFHRLAKS